MTKGAGREFMLHTQYRFLAKSQQEEGAPQPPLELAHDESQAVLSLPLPEAFTPPLLDFKDLVRRRKTLRRYAGQPLTLDELGFLLWATQGVKEVVKGRTVRTVPSAGARHAFETYLLANRVDGLQVGVYRYLALSHQLVPYIVNETIAEQLAKACWDQAQVMTSAATFIWAAVVERMFWRYGERGYRYLHLDAGHVCQNLYLAAEAIQCGVCAIAAYHDEVINPLLGLDGEKQFVIYLASTGKR